MNDHLDYAMNAQTTRFLVPLIPGWGADSLLGAGNHGSSHSAAIEVLRPAEIRPETALGRELSEEEREILDSDKPDENDVVSSPPMLGAIRRGLRGWPVIAG